MRRREEDDSLNRLNLSTSFFRVFPCVPWAESFTFLPSYGFLFSVFFRVFRGLSPLLWYSENLCAAATAVFEVDVRDNDLHESGRIA